MTGDLNPHADYGSAGESHPKFFLRFEGRTEIVGWTGEWPPPERMAVAVGKLTGGVAHVNPADLIDQAATDHLTEIATVRWYRRKTYSTIDPDLPMVLRGALYVLDNWPPS